ncbi:MAG: DUF6472 family protein [Oscillospiraceae bacterium]
MAKSTNCADCANYVYDEYCDCYFCGMNLDEDEMNRFLSSSFYDCPYYRSGDDYEIVKKQN